MIEGPKTGWASSVQVYRSSAVAGRWQWTASGARGMTMGSAASEDEAWQQARIAASQLERAMIPKGVG